MSDWIPQRREHLTPEWLDRVLREGGLAQAQAQLAQAQRAQIDQESCKM